MATDWLLWQDLSRPHIHKLTAYQSSHMPKSFNPTKNSDRIVAGWVPSSFWWGLRNLVVTRLLPNYYSTLNEWLPLATVITVWLPGTKKHIELYVRITSSHCKSFCSILIPKLYLQKQRKHKVTNLWLCCL